jgi:hypothetical protein
VNSLNIPLAWSDCVADSRLRKRVPYAEEDRMGMWYMFNERVTWTYDGETGN